MKRKNSKKVKKRGVMGVSEAVSNILHISFDTGYSLIYITSFPSDCIRFKYVNDLRKFLKMALQTPKTPRIGAF